MLSMPVVKLFPNEYQVLRAQIAAHCLAGSLARPWADPTCIEDMAESSILAAEVLLDRLGIIDPDSVRG